MGRAPCCDKEGLKKGPWTPDEDQKLIHYIQRHGHGSWREIPKRAGLLRCGKSCRLRWTNYLRPDIKRGKFSSEEDETIIQLHAVMGNKWSAIAARLPGRTDNEIKNHWHTHLKKRLLQMGIDPMTHRPRMDLFDFSNMSQFLGAAALSQMTAAGLQEAVIREHLRIAAAAVIQQGVDHYTENTGAISTSDLLLRSQLQNCIFRPDFTNSAMTPPCWLHISENQPGQSGYQNLEQMQYQNIEDSFPTSTFHGLDTIPNVNPEQKDNNNQAIAISDEQIDSNKIYNSVLNAATMMLQQQPPSKSHDIISSLRLWPGDSNGVSGSVSALTPFTSSTGDESFAFPGGFPFSFSENSEQIPDMQNSEEGRDYWSTMLKYVAETRNHC